MLQKKQHKILTYVIEFIKKFSKRITLILSYKFGQLGSYVQKYSDASPSLPFRTYAYIQELDKTICILSQMFSLASEWKAKAKSEFELIFYLLTNRTIKFFSGNTPLSMYENFVPVSYLEKISQKILLSQKGSSSDTEMMQNPSDSVSKFNMKSPMHQINFSKHSLISRKHSKMSNFSNLHQTSNKGLETNLFLFKIEVAS